MPPLTRRAMIGLGGITIGFILTGSFNVGSSDKTIGPFEGILVDNAPADAAVIDGSDERIASVAVIQGLLDTARDPGSERRTWETSEAEYERVRYSGSDTEMQAAADALDDLPRFEGNDRYPAGTYIRDGDQIVAVYYDYLG